MKKGGIKMYITITIMLIVLPAFAMMCNEFIGAMIKEHKRRDISAKKR